MNNSIKLGTSADLLSGFDPLWFSGNERGGLFAPLKKPMAEVDLSTTGTKGDWEYPVISLHANAELLINELFPAKLSNPGGAGAEAAIMAGPLMLSDTDRAAALTKLQQMTGVDFAKADRGYALVKLVRKDTALSHASVHNGILQYANPIMADPALGVNEEYRQALIRLRPCLGRSAAFSPANFTVAIVNEYLEIFRNYGTHYVSAVDMGDCFFQVFAYEKANFERVKTSFAKNDFAGENSNLFAYLTTQGGPSGYAAEVGKIVSFSNDAQLTESIAAKEWLEPVWAKANSLFAIFNDNPKVGIEVLGTKFTAVTALSYRLTTLSLLTELNRREAWRRIFSGAITQRFPAGSKPNLKKYRVLDDGQIFGSANFAGFSTAIATPVVNTYKPRLELADISFVAGNTVQSLTLSTNLLKVSAGTDCILPGKAILITAETVLAETADKAATLVMPAGTNSENNVLYSNEFFGVLRLVNQGTGKQNTILDGIKLGTATQSAGARGHVVAESDIRTAPPAGSLEKTKQSLQFSYAFLQSSLHSSIVASNVQLQDFIYCGLDWIVKQIPATTTDIDLLNIRLMSLDVITNAITGVSKSFVPLLPANEYEQEILDILSLLDTLHTEFQAIQNKIEQRKTQELIMDVGQALNENIIASGKATLEYIETAAGYQKAMSGYYASIATNQEKQYEQILTSVDILNDKVVAQQNAVNTAIDAYKLKVDQWKTMKAISTAFEIIGNIFSAAGGGGEKIAEAGKAVEEMAKTIEKIKKILKFLPVLANAYSASTDAAREIANANSALDTVGGAGELQMTPLEWDEMLVNLTTVLAEGPGEGEVGDAKEELLGAYKILVLRGKALLEAKASAGRLAWEMYNNIKLREISAEQEEKVSKIKVEFRTLDPKTLDASNINLVGLSGTLDLLQNQMLTMLANAFTIRDQALQYEYLQGATAVASFDLLGFKTAITSQRGKTRKAKEDLTQSQVSDTKIINYRIEGVPVAKLIKGNTFRVTIGLDSKEFLEYVNARVISVVATVSTKVNTPSTKVLVLLRCVADPFFDRDMKRDKVTYYSLPRERTYQYESGTMTPNFSDEGNSWSQGVNPVTPFSIWEISFPDSSLNKDISFSSVLTDITLGFRLHARIVDKKNNLLHNLAYNKELFKVGAGEKPSKDAILAQMAARGTVTNGWDVVYNMAFEKINASLKEQFDEVKADPKYHSHIEVRLSSKGVGGKENIKKMKFDLGYSQLEFLSNNAEYLKITCAISGSITLCEKRPNQPEECDPPATFTGQVLTATIPLAVAKGIVAPAVAGSQVYSVVLEMAAGSFSADHMDITPEEMLDLSKALKAYFVANPVRFVISSLDLSSISTLADMRPSNFLFKVLVTQQENKILQLFIQTGGRLARDPSQMQLNELPEPIPLGNTASLIVSSEIFFKSALTGSVQGGWTLAGVAPEGTRKSWMAKVTAATVDGVLDTSGIDKHQIDLTQLVYLQEGGGKNISLSLESMTIKPTGSGTMHMDYSKRKGVDFFVHKDELVCYETGKGTNCKWTHSTNKYNTDVNVTIGATMPMQVGGEGKNQTVTISISNDAVNVEGQMSGGGSCGCDNIQNVLNRAIKAQIPPKITAALNVPFSPISVFALKNLLFPGSNVIVFKSVHVPGDLVIFGDFLK